MFSDFEVLAKCLNTLCHRLRSHLECPLKITGYGFVLEFEYGLLESLDIGDPVPCQAAAGSSKAISNLPCGHHSALLFHRYIGDLRHTEIMGASSQCILFSCAHTFPLRSGKIAYI
jgi:hypothetical protein